MRIAARREASVTTDEQARDPGETIDFEELLRDLDAILDDWFMGLVTPALDDARRAREAPGAEAA
jgi:hypothetical protein